MRRNTQGHEGRLGLMRQQIQWERPKQRLLLLVSCMLCGVCALLGGVSVAYGFQSLQHFEEHVEAHLDWQKGLATATATFPIPDHGQHQVQAEALAIRGATLAARSKLFEALGGPTGVEPEPMIESPAHADHWKAMRELYGILESSYVVSESTLPSGEAQVTVAAWFDRNRAKLALRSGKAAIVGTSTPSIRRQIRMRRVEAAGKGSSRRQGQAAFGKPSKQSAQREAPWSVRMAVQWDWRHTR